MPTSETASAVASHTRRSPNPSSKPPLAVEKIPSIAFLVILAALYFALSWSSGYWSISARSSIPGEPCSMIFTFEGDPERSVRVDGVTTDSLHRRYLIKERGQTTLRSVKVILGDREKTTTLRQSLSGGTNVALTINGDLGVESWVDLDHHM